MTDLPEIIRLAEAAMKPPSDTSLAEHMRHEIALSNFSTAAPPSTYKAMAERMMRYEAFLNELACGCEAEAGCVQFPQGQCPCFAAQQLLKGKP